MARDWKTTYVPGASSATHIAPFPQATIAGRKLVAFGCAPASVDPSAPFTEIVEASDPAVGDLSVATMTATGGQTSITWVREPAASTAPRTLAGWVESRDDLGAVHAGTLSVYGNPSGSGSISLAPVVTTVEGCRIYVCVVTVNDATAWTPTIPGFSTEDIVAAPALGAEPVRMAVATAVVPAGATAITITGVPISPAMVAVLAFEPVGPPAPDPETLIEAENRQVGTDKTTWDVAAAGDPTIQGFATSMHVNRGTGLEVKVHSPSSAWTGKVYRLGWYGGRGAREVATITGPQTTQPSGTTDATTGMASCANWAVNGTWLAPADAVPGVYVITISRDNLTTAKSHIGPFAVINPAHKAPITVKLSDTTWAAAYNHAGANPADIFNGKNLYGQGSSSGFTADAALRCKAVSYDRPIVTRRSYPQTHFFNAEYPLLRWLERLGYDVDYLTCAQVDADPSLLLGRDVVISSGHDEYWSAGMRDAHVAARDSSTDPSHLVFLSGNEAFWRIRWDGSRRTYACWKDSLDGSLNPTGLYSGTWQDTRAFNTDRRPASLLVGQRFRLNAIGSLPLVATSAHAASPLWRNTAVAALTGSTTWSSPAGIVGFEADEPADTSSTEKPAGLIRLSQGSHAITGQLADDNGATYSGSGTYVHALTAYRASTGAVVVGFGTCQYAWALDAVHDRAGTAESPVLQQAFINLIADLGQVPPEYPLPSGMELPSPAALTLYGFPDVTGPTTPSGLQATAGQDQITLTWSASTDDTGVTGYDLYRDGVLVQAGVGGTAYTFTGLAAGTTYLLAVRAKDAAGNQSAAASISTATPVGIPVLFTLAELDAWTQTAVPSATGNLILELVTTEIRGYVGGVRFDALPSLVPLKRISLDLARRMIRNAAGLRSMSRQIDDFTQTDTWATETLHGAELTDDDRAAIDRALGDTRPTGAFTIRPTGSPDRWHPRGRW